MATLTPEQWLKQNTPKEDSTSKKLSPEEYLASKNITTDNRVPTTKVQTPEEYLKDKQITTTKKESLLSKAGTLGKAIAKDVYETAATIPVRATQAGAAIVGQAAFDNPELRKKAFEYASQPVDIGFGAQVKPLNTSSATSAAKQTAGDILKTASLTNIGGKLTLAKQAALQGGAYAAGSALQEDKTPIEIAKDTAIGAGAGLVGGKVLSKVFEKGAKVASKVDDTVPVSIPETTPTSVTTPEVTPVPTEVVKPIKSDVIYGKKEDGQPYSFNVSSQTISGKSKISDPKKEVYTVYGEKVSETADTINIKYTAEDGKSYIQPIKKDTLIENKPLTPKPITYTKDPVQSLAKTMETELPPDADPTFINTTLADQTAKYDSVASVTPTDDLIDMAMGIKPIPEGLSPVSIHALTSIRNDLTVDQAIRLKNIYPLSKAGQELSLARLKSGAIIDNPVDMMQSVEKEMKEQVVKRVISKNDIKNLFPDCGFN